MLIINLDEKSNIPKYKQIIHQIIEKINNGSLKADDKLPSTRKLSEVLGIHRSTVSIAYQELWSLGYIDLNSGSCAVIRNRKKLIKKESIHNKGIIDWNSISSKESRATLNAYLENNSYKECNVIDFSTLNIDGNILPIDSFRSCLNKIIREKNIELFQYGDPLGYLPLREYISCHLENHGISVSSEEIFITNGTQQSIDLVLRLIGSGKSIVVEAPTYKEIIPLINQYKLKALEIPMEADGMNLVALEEKVKSEKPALIYTMPNFQNPTGITTSQVHREKLLSISEKYKIPIMEDGFQEEMKYFGKVVLPIKSMDKNNAVIYCSTFSKVLFPGVRVGWISADKDLIQRLTALRHFSEISLSMILQAGLYDFCSKGYYDKHLSMLHRIYRKRMRTAINSLNKYVDKNIAYWQEPIGGYLIWLKIKEKPSISMEEAFKANGIKVSFGHNYFYSNTKDLYFRLSISSLSEEEIEEGIKRLGRTLKNIYI